MVRKKTIALIIIAFLIVGGVAYNTIPDPRITATSKNFVMALINNENPEEYCTGDVLFRIKTREIFQATPISIKATLTDNSKNFGRVYIEAEIELPDKNIDVGFYEAELIKEDTWKVYSFRETMPRANSFSIPWNLPELDQFYKDVFKQLSQGDDSSLAGPAKTAFKSQPALETSPEISDLKTEILYNSKLVIAKHTYIYDQRQVKVLAHYYKTTAGHKIVSIQAI